MHSFGENRIFIIGTIFNKDGFGQEIFTRFTCYEKFITELKNTEQKFFGHYVVICMDVENQSVEAVSYTHLDVYKRQVFTFLLLLF